MPVVRLVRCDCGHKLRFGSSTCPMCYFKTPVRNRYWPWYIFPVAVSVIAIMAML